jgi:hypothetical protein
MNIIVMIIELPRLCEPFPLIPFAKWSDSQWLQLYSSYSQPLIMIIINKMMMRKVKMMMIQALFIEDYR